MVLVRGIHEYEDGTQRIDGESCSLNEFEDVVLVEDNGEDIVKEYRTMYDKM